MQLHKIWRMQLIVLITIVTSACRSANLAPAAHSPPPQAQGGACQKADAMWKDKIMPSRYAQLPQLTSPGVFGLLTLASSAFSVKALSTEGDELEQGRRKLIHAFGAEVRLRLLVDPAAVGSYTGIFQGGAECIIGRFSQAIKPTSDRSIPAMALKIFIDGDQPSLNLHLMQSIDGQAGHNFFGQTFSNILPPATGFSTRLLAGAFERSAKLFNAKDLNPGRLTLEHLAARLSNGKRVAIPKAPFQLLFKPSAQAHAHMRDASQQDDFRLALAALPVGMVLYEVSVLAEREPAARATPLGQLVLTAPVVSSRHGDEKLYFQHNMERK